MIKKDITDTVIDTIVSVTVSAFLCLKYWKQGDFTNFATHIGFVLPWCYGFTRAQIVAPPYIVLSFRYHECNSTDNDAVKTAFEGLYQRMHGMSLREMDRIVDAVCTFCREHERAGFTEGIKVGVRLAQELV